MDESKSNVIEEIKSNFTLIDPPLSHKQSEKNEIEKTESTFKKSLDQIAEDLKNSVFSKYVTNYLIRIADEMWQSYEKRIDQMIEDKQINRKENRQKAQLSLCLENFLKNQQLLIDDYQKQIEEMCSSSPTLLVDRSVVATRTNLDKDANDHQKQLIQIQSTRQLNDSRKMIFNPMHLPRTPQCRDQMLNGSVG